MSRQHGASLIEALVAAAIGILMLSRSPPRWPAGRARSCARRPRRSQRHERPRTEAFLFDVRRAGYDPAAIGVRLSCWPVPIASDSRRISTAMAASTPGRPST